MDFRVRRLTRTNRNIGEILEAVPRAVTVGASAASFVERRKERLAHASRINTFQTL